MQAYVMHGYGGPDRTELGNVATPSPGAGEVAIQVHAAGLNPVDYKIREGKLRVIYRYRLPCVLGNELAGVVLANGAGAARFAAGDRVYARVAKDRLGAFAQIACVPEAFVAHAPASIDLVHAAAVPLAALTALQALRDELHAGTGQKLLITGGAGGVGSFAIPLAKWLGAHVTTTASTRGEALVRALGADRVIDYTRERMQDHAGQFDAVFDLVGGKALELLFATVRRGGRLVSIAGAPEPRTARTDLQRGGGLALLFRVASARLRRLARRQGVDYRYLFMHPSGCDLAELAALIDGGQLKVTLDRAFDFAQIGAAFAYLEQGHAKGKVVVRMPLS